jgi:hypothetical protein
VQENFVCIDVMALSSVRFRTKLRMPLKLLPTAFAGMLEEGLPSL